MVAACSAMDAHAWPSNGTQTSIVARCERPWLSILHPLAFRGPKRFPSIAFCIRAFCWENAFGRKRGHGLRARPRSPGGKMLRSEEGSGLAPGSPAFHPSAIYFFQCACANKKFFCGSETGQITGAHIATLTCGLITPARHSRQDLLPY